MGRPLEEYVPALVQAIEAAENHLRAFGFEPNRLVGAMGFTRIASLRDAVDALYTTDEAKRRFEIMAREVFCRMKTLILEPSVRAYYIRHDNLEATYKKLGEMLASNPQRMDYYKQYQAIIADYNREKDRATVEETFAKVAKLVAEMDGELRRHVREGLSEDELAFFDMLLKENVSKGDRERVKQASKSLLAAVQQQLATMPNWTKNETTRAEVRICILDKIYTSLARPPFTDADADALAERIYRFVWQRCEAGNSFAAAA